MNDEGRNAQFSMINDQCSSEGKIKIIFKRFPELIILDVVTKRRIKASNAADKQNIYVNRLDNAYYKNILSH